MRVLLLSVTVLTVACPSGAEQPIAKAVLKFDRAAENLLKPDAWRPWQQGFVREAKAFVSDNGSDAKAQRGVGQTVVLNQKTPRPIVAVAESRAEGVTGSADNDYALYLDLLYADGTSLWGQTAPFATGTHDWQRRQVTVVPEKPINQVGFYMLLRGHGGKAWFRNPRLQAVETPAGACTFDGVPVAARKPLREAFQVRDVAAGSDFVYLDREALGVKLDWKTAARDAVTHFGLTLSDTTGKDRAVSLLYAVPLKESSVGANSVRWLHDPRRSMAAGPNREYMNASQFRVGSTGRLSRYPLAAVADAERGIALGIDPAYPAFFRIGYHSGTGELFLAYDVGLTPEKPTADLRFVRFTFDGRRGFRGALARYYEIFPDHFRCRTPRQGLWMPFAKISEVQGWEDFGFQFKEGTNETKWDDEHAIITFRYTEPMTWWMRMPKDMPRSLDAALAEASRLADKGDARAMALRTSGVHDPAGRLVARFRDTPWCDGAVWSMNAMPTIRGETTEFKNKWNADIRERLYGPKRPADLDGEYIDSSEGYVTSALDFRRDHFAAAKTPLTFSLDEHKPAIFRGLMVFEYVRAIADDVHGIDKLMMANGTPGRLCWLAPMLDVMGTETNWNRDGWRPMSDAELLYRRAMCRGKPYCFLMNTPFENFSHELVEKYMKRSLAYGMFPGFFSHNASQGHYFTRPELYNRDRPLFKKYVPLCRRVAEAGWEPITRARSSDEHVYVERFGRQYLTVLNDGPDRRTVTIRLEGKAPRSSRELVTGRIVDWQDDRLTLTLDGEDVAVVELAPK